MTYIADAQLQARAAELWRTYELDIGFDMEALLDRLGLSLLWDELEEQRGQVTLGALRPGAAQVVINEHHLQRFEANRGLLRFTLAHETGHWVLHCAAARSGTGSIFTNDRTWCRDGSSDPVEIQADGFASYLLMPADRLRPELPSEPWAGWPTVYRLAERFAVSPTAMIVRLQRGGWAHRAEDGTPRSGSAVSVAAEQPQLRLL